MLRHLLDTDQETISLPDWMTGGGEGGEDKIKEKEEETEEIEEMGRNGNEPNRRVEHSAKYLESIGEAGEDEIIYLVPFTSRSCFFRAESKVVLLN